MKIKKTEKLSQLSQPWYSLFRVSETKSLKSVPLAKANEDVTTHGCLAKAKPTVFVTTNIKTTNFSKKIIKNILTAQRLDQYVTTAQKGTVGNGIKLILKGRLNSSGIASKQIFALGSVPKQKFDSPIREKNVAIRTVKGLIGLKIITS